MAGIQISKFRFGYEIMCGAMTRIDDVNLEAPNIFEISEKTIQRWESQTPSICLYNSTTLDDSILMKISGNHLFDLSKLFQAKKISKCFFEKISKFFSKNFEKIFNAWNISDKSRR